MKSTDYAYAAGYIDGDGCFQIGNQKWGSHLVVVSTRKQSILWFMEKFDGSIRKILPRTDNRLPSYHFRFSIKGLNELPQISKFLVEKQSEFSVFQEFRNACGLIDKNPFTEQMKVLKNEFGLIDKSPKIELTSIRNTIIPTEEDFAYLAGFIDAECSLDVSRVKQKKGTFYTYRPQIQCNNSKYPFFFWVSARFGGQFHFLDKSNVPNCRNQLLWRISNKQLDPILQGIFPYLISKKSICEKMIELRKYCIRKGRVSSNDPEFNEKYMVLNQLKESLYNQIIHLNNI